MSLKKKNYKTNIYFNKSNCFRKKTIKILETGYQLNL